MAEIRRKKEIPEKSTSDQKNWDNNAGDKELIHCWNKLLKKEGLMVYKKGIEILLPVSCFIEEEKGYTPSSRYLIPSAKRSSLSTSL